MLVYRLNLDSEKSYLDIGHDSILISSVKE